MFKTILLASLMLILLTACENGPKTDSFCQLAKPIYLDKQDKLTPNTAKEILSHDETGHSYCNWGRV